MRASARRSGFSLVELILALLLLQVGLLATAAMILLSQQHLRRAELTLRSVLESEAVADSLVLAGAGSSGQGALSWGSLFWSPVSTPIPGMRVSAWSPLEGDTLAFAYAFSPLPGSFPVLPDSSTRDGGE